MSDVTGWSAHPHPHEVGADGDVVVANDGKHQLVLHLRQLRGRRSLRALAEELSIRADELGRIERGRQRRFAGAPCCESLPRREVTLRGLSGWSQLLDITNRNRGQQHWRPLSMAACLWDYHLDPIPSTPWLTC
jgi:hypothetical protein